MKAAKASFTTTIAGGSPTVINSTGVVNLRHSARPGSTQAYPTDSIGSDLVRRNYVRYLVQRYNQFKRADVSFGKSAARFSYAVIFKNIEAKFKAPTYFIHVNLFDPLVDYLHNRIDGNTLGKRNRARGQRNYETFDEYQLAQAGGTYSTANHP